jgi:hypothetical protein
VAASRRLLGRSSSATSKIGRRPIDETLEAAFALFLLESRLNRIKFRRPSSDVEANPRSRAITPAISGMIVNDRLPNRTKPV